MIAKINEVHVSLWSLMGGGVLNGEKTKSKNKGGVGGGGDDEETPKSTK